MKARRIMTSVTIKAVVDEGRQLHIVVPDDMPLGPVEVTVMSVADAPENVPDDEVQTRAMLVEAGLLNTGRYAPPDAKPLSEEEREELARLYSGEPSVSDMIIEDRRERWD
jgi:hypothetical protein